MPRINVKVIIASSDLHLFFISAQRTQRQTHARELMHAKTGTYAYVLTAVTLVTLIQGHHKIS